MRVLFAIAAGLLACGSTEAPRAPCGHAHNDYENPRPLLDALAQNFCSVEADLHLVGGELLVAHDAADVMPGRTLRSLYLDPLRANPPRTELTLLLDLKSEGAETYAALEVVLAEYRDILSEFSGITKTPRAVTAIISGDVPREVMSAEATRLAAIDGRVADLDGDTPPALIPLVSDDWDDHFHWVGGLEPMPPLERKKLADLAAKAHAGGRRLRFWNTFDLPEVWTELVAAEVDLINTDDPEALGRFLGR